MKHKYITLGITIALLGTLLAGCGKQTPAAASVSVPASQAASTAQSAPLAAPESETLSPVYAAALHEGTYDIEVESSSSMFRVTQALLTVQDGKMSAVLTLSGTGYKCLYMGTGEQALQAAQTEMIPYIENAAGEYTYTVPVEALNKQLDCAAFSIKKEKWYDRTLLLKADTLPKEATNAAADSAALADGSYQMEAVLRGGSGKASVASPARVTVKGGKMTATIEWSSAHYDYMLVNGEKYTPVNTTGNAVFEIPVSAINTDIAVTADTTAMSKPHEVEYTLCFSKPVEQPEK